VIQDRGPDQHGSHAADDNDAMFGHDPPLLRTRALGNLSRPNS
jgi:hypothetical protein